MREISILGCGWFGLPLGKSLAEKGFSVKGSTTSESKIAILKDSGIRPFLLALSAEKPVGNIGDFLSSEILIIAVPPRTAEGNFAEKISLFIPLIEKSSITKVLFISSISVYGENDGLVTEDTIPNPATENGKQILEAERLLQNGKFETAILRFGGLLGEDRHPVKYLAGRQNLENPNAPINLIHLDDCIGIILKIIKAERWNETFNGVAPYHPSRAAYYTVKAIEMNLPLPQFANSKTLGKIIDSKKVIADLRYDFQKPQL